jgi:GT2 family glycosyltransferase
MPGSGYPFETRIFDDRRGRHSRNGLLGKDFGLVEAVVCIPTFRRPEGLAQTLRSLLDQRGDVRFAIVVVENDAANPVGAQRAESILATADMPSLVVMEPKQGNCHAINRAFGEARSQFPSADYVLMIDDDEIASPDWLAHMVGTARRTGADIVGGPVMRRFEVPVSRSISEHSLNGSISGPTRQVPIIHGSGNCLIRRGVFSRLSSALFDTRFNFLGGGDMDFFVRCRAAGCVFWWCAEAVIHETVAKERANALWLMRRSIRTGSINYVIDRNRAHSPAAIALLQVKNAVSLGLGLCRSLALFATTRRLLPATHPFLTSLGRTTASLGFIPKPYEASATPAAYGQGRNTHDGQSASA